MNGWKTDEEFVLAVSAGCDDTGAVERDACMGPVLGKVDDGENNFGRELQALLKHGLGHDDIYRRWLVWLGFSMSVVGIGLGCAGLLRDLVRS